MKTIIAGSRSIHHMHILKEAIKIAEKDKGIKITSVLSGRAMGADTLGEQWATENGIPVQFFPAQWSDHGKAAGFMRNREMVKVADAAIFLWDGISRGTQHCMAEAEKKGIKVMMIQVRVGINARARLKGL